MSTLKTNRIENLTTTDGGISINNSGHVGIGTSSPTTPLSVRTSSNITTYGDVSAQFSDNSTGTLYVQHSSGKVQVGSDSVLAFGSGTSATERLRIDSSGNVGIGTSSPQRALQVGTHGSGNGEIALASSTSGVCSILMGDGATGTDLYRGYVQYNNSSDAMLLATSATERMRIDSDGHIDIGANGGSSSGEGFYLQNNGQSYQFTPSALDAINIYQGTTRNVLITSAGNATFAGSITLSADSPDWTINPSGISNLYGRIDLGTDSNAISGTALYVINDDDNSYAAAANFKNKGTGPSFICLTSAGSDAFRVENNGDVKSATNSYGAVSDVKMKENIVDASSQWDDVKAIRVRKFNFKEDTLYDTSTQIGVIAQEIETVSPGLVTSTVDSDAEGNELGTVTKSVKYSVLYMKSVKALQEAMSRIETLEAEVAALKSN